MKHEVGRVFFAVAAKPPQVDVRRHKFPHRTASIVRAGSMARGVVGDMRSRRAHDTGWRSGIVTGEEDTFGGMRRGTRRCANMVANEKRDS
jgi:hypothetical protein